MSGYSQAATEKKAMRDCSLLTVELLNAGGTPCLSYHRFRELLGGHWRCEPFRRTDSEWNSEKLVDCDCGGWEHCRGSNNLSNIDS